MKRVLIVDDDTQLCAGLVPLLAEYGYAGRAFRHGAEAVAAQRVDHFDIALVDLFMPEMDGLEVLQQLHAAAPRLPVVITSGGGHYHDCRLLKAALRLGARAILLKPFTEEELFSALRNDQAHRTTPVDGALPG